MPRIRTIKPEFFTSEDIVGLSPMARLLYVATWCEADKEGRLLWKPRTFKLRYFPADDCDIDALARELVASALVIPYGDGLAHIPSFKKHQHISPRESASILPDPSRVGHASARVTDATVTHREEGKGREGDSTRRFTPPSPTEVSAFASEHGITLDASAFVDFYASKGWRVGRDPMKDWRAAARNWARRDAGEKQAKTAHWSTEGLVI